MPDNKPPESTDQSPAGVDTTRDAPASSPRGPHEKDETTGSTGGVPSATVQQAARDVKRGIQDTSRGAESDQAYQKQK